MLLSHLRIVLTGQFSPESDGQFPAEQVVSLIRNGVVSFSEISTLSSFVMFTGVGGVANTGASIYNGNVGTDLGVISGFLTATVNGTIYQPKTGSTVITKVYPIATFSLYKNGALIPNSSRTRTHLLNPSDISLQGITTITAGETVDVRWRVEAGTTVSVANRILTLIKVGN